MNISTLLNPGFSFFGIWDVKWYGVIMAFSMLMGIVLAFYTCKKKGYKSDIIFDLALAILPLAIVGARLYFCIFYGVDSFAEIFAIWNGGMAIYGGVIGGIIGVFIVSKVKKVSFIDLCDIAAPCLILGQAIGRWGNFVNQEAYGYATNSMQFFPFAVYIDSCTQEVCSCGGSGWHLATFFYESFWNIIGVVLLLILLNKVKKTGITTFAYFAYYGLGRSFIEGMRTDSLMFLGLRVSQWLSIALLIFGAIMLYFVIKKDIFKPKYLNPALLVDNKTINQIDKPQETENEIPVEEQKDAEKQKVEDNKKPTDLSISEDKKDE